MGADCDGGREHIPIPFLAGEGGTLQMCRGHDDLFSTCVCNALSLAATDASCCAVLCAAAGPDHGCAPAHQGLNTVGSVACSVLSWLACTGGRCCMQLSLLLVSAVNTCQQGCVQTLQQQKSASARSTWHLNPTEEDGRKAVCLLVQGCREFACVPVLCSS